MFGPRHEHRLAMIVREVEALPAGSRVLDAAVGLGQLAGRMAARGYTVFGIDSAIEAAHHARHVAGIASVVGDLTRLPFRNGAVDGVTTGETLEHLDDDAGAAREIARVVRADGLVVATVPALETLWSASDDYYEHRRRYGRGQLREMFRAAGFGVRKAAFWGFPIVLIYDTLFLLPMNKRRARRDVGTDAGLQSVARAGRSRMLINAVRATFSIDRLFSWIPFGPGLLLVARKIESGTED
jgi:SAM-dependent methyltransferase